MRHLPIIFTLCLLPSCGTQTATIHTANGHTAQVSAAHAFQFQSFINDLEGRGYAIKSLGGVRKHGSCKGCDKHPKGEAIDINQTARNRVTARFPRDVTTLAAAHGLFHGALWCHPDTGHFEVNPRAPACQGHK